MIRTNLSTRPFYNERMVHVLLAAIALVLVGVTAYNLLAVFTLSGRQAQLQARIGEFGQKAERLRAEAARIRASIDPRELEATVAEAREVNAVIERRTFSWTELFNHFEATLPDNVRISSVRPRTDRDGPMVITINVVARGVEGVDTFIERLEQLGVFSGLLSREEFVTENGLLQAAIEGRYRPQGHRGSAR